jgi:hypothetical protein
VVVVDVVVVLVVVDVVVDVVVVVVVVEKRFGHPVRSRQQARLTKTNTFVFITLP